MRRLVAAAALALVLDGCALSFGRNFPSPAPDTIRVGVTTKEDLRRVFGEPYRVGLDSGDPTWSWFYAEQSAGGEATKDFTVRFNRDGTVKSYAFTSNFPEDMQRLR